MSELRTGKGGGVLVNTMTGEHATWGDDSGSRVRSLLCPGEARSFRVCTVSWVGR